MQTFPKVILLLLFSAALVQSYDQIDGYNELMNYHEEYSQYPIIHVYYNRHFSKSRQFEDFLETLEETEYRNKDYAKFVLTDCELFKQGQTYACDQMRVTKDNRMIFGYYPTDEFVNYGGKKMQNPPKHRQFNHPRDVYTVPELQNFIEEMIPNFFEELQSIDQYKEWLKPKYSPKLIFASREEEIPLVVRKLGVHYFLRFDLAFLSDLSESVVKELNITSFPQLLVLKFNFQTNTYETFAYSDIDFSTKNYQKIKEFLQPHALQQPRNDLLFHKMKMIPDQRIFVTDNKAEVQEILNKANGWVIIEAVTGEPLKLKMIKQRYGRFFQYLHFISGNQTQKLQIYDPDKQLVFDLPEDQVYFKALTKQVFIQTVGAWIKKNYVMIGVRQRYGHYCAIAQQVFFRGLTQCIIIKEQEYEQASKGLNMEFEIGFACYQTNQNTKEKIKGRIFKNTNFEDIYLSVEYLTRLKSKQIVDEFMEKPIKSIIRTEALADICNFPFKKCALLFTHSSKTDRTAYDYLKDVAINFINQYQFLEIDLACNPEFQKEIDVLKRQAGGLVVYHPSKSSYVTLKAKLSKSTFQKFLKANLQDNKKIPFHKFGNEKIEVHRCEQRGSTSEKQAEQEL